MPAGLSAQDRILLHLLDFVRFEDETEVPYGVSQSGLADRTGVMRSHIPRAVKRLIAQGALRERVSRVRGGGRSRRVYFLTWEGQLAARELRERLGTTPVSIRSSSGVVTVSAAEAASMCRGAGLLDVLLAAGAGPLDPATVGGRLLREGVVEWMESAPPPALFYGRREELRTLAAWLGGETRLVQILGPPGVGKSSLARELARQMRGKEHLLWLNVHDWDTAQALLGALGRFLAATGRRRLSAALAAPAAPGLPGLHDILISELRDLDALVIIDDLQRASEEALGAVRALAEAVIQAAGARLLVLSRRRRSLCRPSELARGAARELALGGLDEESSLRLVGAGLPPEERRAVLAAAQGHPLYLHILSRSGIKAGRGEVWEHIRTELLSSLSDEERAVLGAASIFSAPVPAPALLSSSAGPAALDSLVERGLLRASPEGLYEMHDMLREFFRSRLTPGESRELHLRAAEHLLGSSPLREGDALEALHHLMSAGERGRAAGEALRLAPALVAAGLGGALLAEVLEGVGAGDCPPEEWRRLLLLRAEMLEASGERDRALREYGEAAGGGGPLAAEARLGIGRILEERSDWGGAAEAYSAAALDPPSRPAALRGAARVAWRRGRWREAKPLFEDALKLARRNGRRALAASILTDMANLESDAGDAERALLLYERSLGALEAEGELREAARVHNNMGAVLFYEDRWEEAMAHYQSSLELAERCGEVSTKAYALSNIGQILSRRGEEERALRYLDESSRVFERLGDEYMVSTNLLARGILYRELGDWERSRAFFRRGLEALQRLDMPREMAEAEYEYGLALMRKGEKAEARKRLRSALETYRRLGAEKELRRVERELRKLG